MMGTKARILTGDVIFNQLNRAAKQSRDILHAGYMLEPTRTMEYITLDPDHGFVDPRLRQALALALDKSALAMLLGGEPTNHLIPLETGAYSTTLKGDIATAPLTGDVMRAQALWQAYVRDRCGDDAARCPLVPLSWLEFGGSGISSTVLLALKARWEQTLPGIRIVESDPPGLLISEPPSGEAESALINDAIVIPLAQHEIQMRVRPGVVNLPLHLDWWIAPDAWAKVYLAAPAN